MMNTEPLAMTFSYPVTGGDYEHGGAASKHIKEILKKIGVVPQIVRRTMIAAYEAEMNVVIHAHRGRIKVAATPELLDVIIEDEGPGIPDIDSALRDGYSTAPPAARELGFGAGMGLGQIKKNSDRFSLQSKVGQGTRLRFSIFLQPGASGASASNSVAISAESCRACLRCLHACATGAVRVRNGRPEILDHLCVDCTSCVEACEPGALHVGGIEHVPRPHDDTVLVLPGAFLEQFGETIGPGQILDILGEMGFAQIRLLDEWENGLRAAVEAYARDKAGAEPILAPVCPAVINLVRMRFPSLSSIVAPFLTPIEAAVEELTAAHVVFLGICPAHASVLARKRVMTHIEILRPSALRAAVFARVRVPVRAVRRNAREDAPRDIVQVSGMRHIMRVLDAIENGHAEDFRVIEMYACHEGCFGAPIWTEDASIARPRYARELDPQLLSLNKEAGSVRRVDELTPRPGLRLDSDIGAAIRKLGEIDALTKELPGRDCGVCGAPTCTALAEDVVLARASVEACVYRDSGAQPTRSGGPAEAGRL